ncbi:general secretion pathway protein F [Desulfobaculum xiamenense]|uniref:General secretion pathway protein F n=1 Tax=Desulfobaculum xiamenense TaxID=995050 RepID=A0A846QQH5_9BACT|nr:type II secretion system F family protein [Desulfobaculum xiamenense]NJB68752.1 general secretion pathway protein F [Desulfobaculum xiamenense]
MPVYRYEAVGADGRTRKDIIDAASRSDAGRKLKTQGLFLVGLEDVGSERGTARTKDGARRMSLARLRGMFRRVRRTEFVGAVQQLATLLDAGLPLDSALTAMIGHGKGTELNRVFAQIRERVRSGISFAAALEEHPRVFSSMFVSMTRAGESSGTLALVMARLADHAARQLEMRRKVQSTLAYPLLMLIVGTGVIAFLMAFVIPKVTQIFFDLGHALPLPTTILIAVSDAVRNWWPALVVLVPAFAWWLRWYSSTSKGRRRVHAFVLRVPLAGSVVRRMAVGRFCRTLGMLLKNGVPMIQSLDIVRSIAGNVVLEQAIDSIRAQVLEGRDMVGPMEFCGIFDPTDLQMVDAGEKSGRLVDMLLTVARSCESEVDARLAVATSLMEPVMILLMGGVVGFIVMAIILPIFEMSHLVG